MKTEAYHVIGQLNGSGILIVGDHASNHVPADINLAIHPSLLNDHIALDIGVAEVAQMLTEQLGCAAILGGASRLVIALTRWEEAQGLLPLARDGHVFLGYHGADREEWLDLFWRPYHGRLPDCAADFFHK